VVRHNAHMLISFSKVPNILQASSCLSSKARSFSVLWDFHRINFTALQSHSVVHGICANGAGVCFPMGRGLYRVVHIPEDEFVLLNSREKAPYLICVEVLKCEAKRFAASFNILLFNFSFPHICVLSFLARTLNVPTFQKMTEKDIDQSVDLL
jgi:hypothetical protein